MEVILNEGQATRTRHPHAVMRKSGNFKPMLKEWLEFDPNIGTTALTNTTSAADRGGGGTTGAVCPGPPV